MGVLFLSIAVGLLSVQSFVQSLVQARLRKRVKDLESGLVKVAGLLGEIVGIQAVLVNRHVSEGK